MVLNPEIIQHHSSIRNIIFDFGGVLCNINISLTEQRFKELGLIEFDPHYSVADRDTLFGRLEEGSITPDAFRNTIRAKFSKPISDHEINDAWNAMLLDFPEDRVKLLEQLKPKYQIFLLSNSNEIHYQKFSNDFRHTYGYGDFNDLFKKAYFSFQIKMKKPDRRIFEHVLNEQRLNPSETLFIDDSILHVKGAGLTGINAHYLDLRAGQTILDLFID